jgi:hypothetical protein
MCGDVKLKMRATRNFEVQLLQMELRQPAIQGPASELQANWPVPDFHMRNNNIHPKFRWTKQTQ